MTLCMSQVNQNGRLTFSGTASQQVSLYVTNSTLASAGVTLVWPDQSTHYLGSFGLGSTFYDTLTLPTTGTYSLLIDPVAAYTGCATFQLFTGTDVYGAITAGGAPVQTCNTIPGQNMNLLFSGTAGQQVSLRVTNSTLASAGVSLVWPDQSTHYLGSFGTSGTFFDTITLPATGTYTLAIDPTGTYTGCATFTLYDVPASPTATIVPGGAPVAICNTVPGQDMALTFSATAGQRVSLQVTNSTLSSAGVTLVWPDQSTHYLGSFGTSGTFFDTITLPATGNYRLEIDPTGTYTGCATFTLYNVPPDTIASATIGGAAVQVCNTVPGQDMALTFSATAGQRVSLQVTNSTLSSAGVTLVWPDQSTHYLGSFGTSGTFFDTITLPATGTYRLEIDPTGMYTGCATFTLYNVPPDTTLSIVPGGAPVAICNTVPGQDMVLTFSGTAGQRVSLRVTNSTLASAGVSLIWPDQSTHYLGSFGTSGTFFDTVTLPSTGAYAFAIDPNAMYTGCATFTLYDVPPDTTASATIGGAAVQVCNTVPGQDMAVTFSGTASQQVTVHITNSTLPSAGVSLVWPDQSTHYLGSFGTTGATLGPVTLPSTGSYTLAIDPGIYYTGCATVGLT